MYSDDVKKLIDDPDSSVRSTIFTTFLPPLPIQ